MKINWRNIYYSTSVIGITFLMFLFLSTTILFSTKINYWKEKAEEYRLDTKYYEQKYDSCRERNNELLYKLYEEFSK